MFFHHEKIGARALGIALFLAAAALAAAPASAQEDPATLGTCVADATHLCYFGDRFSAAMTYERPAAR